MHYTSEERHIFRNAVRRARQSVKPEFVGFVQLGSIVRAEVLRNAKQVDVVTTTSEFNRRADEYLALLNPPAWRVFTKPVHLRVIFRNADESITVPQEFRSFVAKGLADFRQIDAPSDLLVTNRAHAFYEEAGVAAFNDAKSPAVMEKLWQAAQPLAPALH